MHRLSKFDNWIGDIYIYIYMCVCVCVYIYIYIFIHTHIYMYIHTQLISLFQYFNTIDIKSVYICCDSVLMIQFVELHSPIKVEVPLIH